jgi:hypothetical protein
MHVHAEVFLFLHCERAQPVLCLSLNVALLTCYCSPGVGSPSKKIYLYIDVSILGSRLKYLFSWQQHPTIAIAPPAVRSAVVPSWSLDEIAVQDKLWRWL